MKTILIIMILGGANPKVEHIEFDSMKSCEVAKERTINALDIVYAYHYFAYCVEK